MVCTRYIVDEMICWSNSTVLLGEHEPSGTESEASDAILTTEGFHSLVEGRTAGIHIARSHNMSGKHCKHALHEQL